MPDTGAPWNIPYVAGTDLVADWPTDNQTMAEAIADALDLANLGLGSNTVQTVKTDTFSTSTTGSLVDVTGLSASITPSSNTSKVLAIWNLGALDSNANAMVMSALTRGGTIVVQGSAAGSRSQVVTLQYGGGGDRPSSHSFMYLDSPATTSSVTYQVQIQGNGTQYVNRSSTDTDSAIFGRAVSTLTLIEVSA